MGLRVTLCANRTATPASILERVSAAGARGGIGLSVRDCCAEARFVAMSAGRVRVRRVSCDGREKWRERCDGGALSSVSIPARELARQF